MLLERFGQVGHVSWWTGPGCVGAALGAAGLRSPGRLPAEQQVQGGDERASEHLFPRLGPICIQTVHMALRFLLVVFKMLLKYFQNICIFCIVSKMSGKEGRGVMIYH